MNRSLRLHLPWKRSILLGILWVISLWTALTLLQEHALFYVLQDGLRETHCLVHSLPDIWSHEEVLPAMPAYGLAVDGFMAAARADLGAVD